MKKQLSYEVDVSTVYAGLCTRLSTKVSRDTKRRVPLCRPSQQDSAEDLEIIAFGGGGGGIGGGPYY